MQDGAVLLIELRLDENMVAIPLNRWQLLAHFSDPRGWQVYRAVVETSAATHFEALRNALGDCDVDACNEIKVLHQLCGSVSSRLATELREYMRQRHPGVALEVERINPGAPMPPWMG